MLTYSQVKQCIKELGRNELENILNDSSRGEDFLEAVFECDIQLSDIDESYQGQYSSDEEFTEQLISDRYSFDLPNFVYIDWERTARDVMMDYFKHNGYYFGNI